ncbi:MAG: NAD(+) synthase [Muribaculaceae bacterium]|nr:NAD(+) synthase [Muribaculaceae bacterium]
MVPTDQTARFGLYKIAAATPLVEIGNPSKNVEQILALLAEEELKSADIIGFPELSVSAYTCGDLFFQETLLKDVEAAVVSLCSSLKDDPRMVAVGAPLLWQGRLFNCAVVLYGGKIQGVVPKTHIPNYQEFYEKRWFASGEGIVESEIQIGGEPYPFGTDLIFQYQGANVGIEICEDLWVPTPPSSWLCENGADIILNLSATDDNIGKYSYIRGLVASQSARCRCGYAYASAGAGESSTDLVFSGIDLVAADGAIIGANERFAGSPSYSTGIIDVEKLRNDRRKYSTYFDCSTPGKARFIDLKASADKPRFAMEEMRVEKHPFVPSSKENRDAVCREIAEIQSWGLARRLEALPSHGITVGISGGLDSTLALLTAHRTYRKLGLDLKEIVGITMPSKANSERTKGNSHKLMERLGVTAREIPISAAVKQHFLDIEQPEDKYDVVYENGQARERTQILMDVANKTGGIVLGTGDMSELALGWCTYNGDHMSMYNVNAGVPKTLVKYLVDWYADNTEDPLLRETLKDIIDTPISPELIPSEKGNEIKQQTEDFVGPYELNDFYMYHVLRNGFSPAKIFRLAEIAFGEKYSRDELKERLTGFYKRFFSQQFKRSCMPDGPKIGSVCLSPRGDWRMPSDAKGRAWIEEAENL